EGQPGKLAMPETSQTEFPIGRKRKKKNPAQSNRVGLHTNAGDVRDATKQATRSHFLRPIDQQFPLRKRAEDFRLENRGLHLCDSRLMPGGWISPSFFSFHAPASCSQCSRIQ